MIAIKIKTAINSIRRCRETPWYSIAHRQSYHTHSKEESVRILISYIFD